MYFTAHDFVHGIELWKSDGTEAGTVMVRNINASFTSLQPGNFTVVGDQLFFTANDGVHGYELWKTESPAAGT